MAIHTNKPRMSKTEIIAHLNVMVVERLFGGGPYLADEKTSAALDKRFRDMGLEEVVPGKAGRTRITALGKS